MAATAWSPIPLATTVGKLNGCLAFQAAAVDGTTNTTTDALLVAGYQVTVSLEGTFGGTVTVQGSPDPDTASITWQTVSNQAGTAFTATAAGMKVIGEPIVWFRVSAGASVSAVVPVVLLTPR